jgi:AAA15 family ATPase/GTPase
LIVEFNVTNFRSFREKQTLSLKAESLAKHTENNTCKQGKERILRTVAIYGQNGSGKTNMLRALQTMQMIILNSTNPQFILPDCTFKFSEEGRHSPTEFSITFITGNVRYEYGFSFKENRVEKEWLTEFVHARGRLLFERQYDEQTQSYQWDISIHLKGQRAVWKDTTRSHVLFLSNAVQLNCTQFLPVHAWFAKMLIILFGQGTFNSLLTIHKMNNEEGKKQILSFLSEMGLGEILDVEVKREQMPFGATPANPFQIVEHQQNQTSNLLRILCKHPADSEAHAYLEWSEESAGTQVMFRNAGAWINVLQNGEVILIDEIETNLHHLLVEFLIQKFHSSKTNPQNAQLLFTTHNLELLNRKLFRRDQFLFCDKNHKGESSFYSLKKYKPPQNTSLEKWYRRGRFGAIPKIKDNTK